MIHPNPGTAPAGTPPISRRALLSTALAVGSIGTLGACSVSGSGTPGGTGPQGSVPLPTLVASKAPKPDLAGSDKGVQPAYFRYPSDSPQTVSAKPGSGKPLSCMVVTYSTPEKESKYIAAVNEALGTPVNLTLVPEPDYGQRFSTVVAGGDLPDTIQIPLFANLPNIAQFLKAKMVDLSDQLSGDAVKKYPNLAAVPTQSWRNARINGRIYGVPVPRPIIGNRAAFYRKDLVTKRGVAIPTNAEEFKKFCSEFTNHGRGEYAIAGFASGAISPLVLVLFSAMFKVPNQWRNDNGKLTYYIETDEFKQSVDFARQLWQAGYYQPNTPSMKSNQAGNLFGSGKSILIENGLAGWGGTQSGGAASTPGYLVDVLPEFGADGGQGSLWYKEGAFSYSVINAAAKDRVEEILKIMDFCAAPFGSKEYELLNFGVEGVHFKRGASGPVLTDLGKKEIFTSYNYLGAPEQVLFNVELVDKYVKPCHAWETDAAPNGSTDPTVGLYSKTASRDLASLKTTVNDEITAVVVGRKDLSALDELASTWRSKGGDAMRTEFQEALASA